MRVLVEAGGISSLFLQLDLKALITYRVIVYVITRGGLTRNKFVYRKDYYILSSRHSMKCRS